MRGMPRYPLRARAYLEIVVCRFRSRTEQMTNVGAGLLYPDACY
jgi:hypothetical protein